MDTISNNKDTLPRATDKYYDRDDFKKELELKIGHYVDVNLWLQARPKKPLPWTVSDLEESSIYVMKAERSMRTWSA